MSLHDDLDAIGRKYPPRPLVRFGAIGEGWELFQMRMGTWVLTALIVLVCYSAASSAVFSVFKLRPVGGRGGFRVVLPPGGQATQAILSMVVLGFFLGGMFRMACRQVRGLPFDVGTLFSITDALDRLLIGSAIYGVAVVAGCSAFLLPGLVVAGVLMFMYPLIVDGGLSPLDAIARSWHALKGEWLMAALFHLAASFVAGLGSCCCIGLIFTAPLYVLSVSVLYRDFLLVGGYAQGMKQPGGPAAEV